MGRHRKDFDGERLTAQLHLQLTPADRAAIGDAAAEAGVTPSDLARGWVLNGLRAFRIGRPAREAKRAALAGAIERLAQAGQDLNRLAHVANETRNIRSAPAVEAVCERITLALDALPPRGAGREQGAEVKRLLQELAAIGNNVQQLRGIARARMNIRASAALAGMDERIVKALDAVMPP